MSHEIDLDPDLEEAGREQFATDIIRLASLWVAAGALYKLFAGSPGDLPRTVVEQSPLGLAATFRAAISIELIIVIGCLFRPRTSWLWLVALFGLFDAVLWPMVQSGDSSCGCFGGTIEIKPLYMLIIDSVLLLGVLIGRPWSSIPKRPFQPLILLPLVGLAVWAPFHLFPNSTAMLPPKPRPAVHEPNAGAGSAGAALLETAQRAVEATDATNDDPPRTEGELTDEPILEQPISEGDAPEPEATPTEAPSTGDSSSGAVDPPAGWAPISPLPEWHSFDVAAWDGQLLFDIDAYHFVDVEQFPDTCHVVFYRQTCEHCRDHLEELTINPPLQQLVLVRLVENGDTEENNVITALPDTPFQFEMPALRRGYDMQTPVTMDVEGYVISNVTEREH